MKHRIDWPATLCLAGATLSWGTAPVMLRYLVHYVPDGFTTNAVRYPFASLLYVPILIWGLRQRSLGRFWWTALLPAAVNLVGQTLWGAAPYFDLTAGQIAFLNRLSVIWGILGAFCLFPDERPLARRPIFWIGAALALAGFVVMSAAQVFGATQVSIAGLLVMFACGLCYGMYGVTVRYVMGNLNPLVVFAVIGAYTSAGLIALAPCGQPESLLHLPTKAWVVLLVSSLLAIALAHGLYYVAVQRIGAAVSMLMLSVTPFVSLLGSIVFLGEPFTAAQLTGGCILVGGATLAMGAQQHLPHPPAPDPRETANE